MKAQNITNLLGNADNQSLKFATKKWYVINDQNYTYYGKENENGATVKFENKVISNSNSNRWW